MHARYLRIRNFKRFHDLSVEIPGMPNLVMMCGPNGTGKSSVIDAFQLWHGIHGSPYGWFFDEQYHQKAGTARLGQNESIEVRFAESTPPADQRKSFYVRSAYRHEPDFSVGSVSRQQPLVNAPQSRKMIDPESKVSDNYQRLVATAVEELYGGDHDEEIVGVLRDRHIGRIRTAILEVFPELELQGPGSPMEGGTFYFTKARQPKFHYKNLSGGEKAVFDLVLDLVVKTAFYDESVFCIDEPDLHINTRMQGTLLTVLRDLLPAQSQLWIATHSIGMMRKARNIWEGDHSQVAFLDFDDQDFDKPVTLTPVDPDRAFWFKTLRVALDDLADLVAPERVVLCEGRPTQGGNPAKAEFDARCYRRIFSAEYPLVDFISVGDSMEVQKGTVGRAIQTIVSGTKVIRVVDRDARSPQEVADLEKEGVRVLGRRHIESYLLADEMLAALCASAGQSERTAELIAAREAAVRASVDRGNSPDDMKSAAGEFSTAARRLLNLTASGNTTEAFLSDTMAPLLAPGMSAYSDLEGVIFGR